MYSPAERAETNDLIFTYTNDAVRMSAWLDWKQTVHAWWQKNRLFKVNTSCGPAGRSSFISGELKDGWDSICLWLTAALLWPPECHPRQQVYTFLIRILSMSFISVSIFSVCCYSRVSISMAETFSLFPVSPSPPLWSRGWRQPSFKGSVSQDGYFCGFKHVNLSVTVLCMLSKASQWPHKIINFLFAFFFNYLRILKMLTETLLRVILLKQIESRLWQVNFAHLPAANEWSILANFDQ